MFNSWSSNAVGIILDTCRNMTWIILVLIAILLPFVLTFVMSSIRFTRAVRTKDGNSCPPLLPYWLPFVGHTFQFVFNTPRFMSYLGAKFNTPIKVYVGGRFLNFVPHGDSILTLHKKSRKLTNVLIAEKFMADSGLSQADQDRGGITERSGVLPQPNPGWEHLAEHERWNFIEHRDFATYLGGRSQEILAEKFAARFTDDVLEWNRQAAGTADEYGWILVPDLAAFMRRHLFCAATSALYGDELLRVAPELCDDFWELIAQLPKLFRRLPRWLAPRAYAARQRVLASMDKWEKLKSKASPVVPGGECEVGHEEWNSVHGAKMTRSRTKMYHDFGLSEEGASLFHFAMMFALNPNAVSATTWALIDVLRSSNLISRVRAETAPCFAKGLPIDVDVARLSASPLLGSIFMETLRVRAASPVGRTPIDETFTVGPWRFESDVHILSTSWLGGHDASFWNEGGVVLGREDGRPRPAHPVDEFWAERFLEYPDDPHSGPIKKHTSYEKQTRDTGVPRTVDDDLHARLVTAGIAGHWYPFGGGLNTCPGRFFAKKEVMLGVAIMLRVFDFEGLEASKVVPDMDNFPFGVLPPKGKVSVRIRRRQLG